MAGQSESAYKEWDYPKRYQHGKNINKGIVILLLSGSATDFLGKVTYQLITPVTSSSDKLMFNLISAYVLVALSFLACIGPPIFSPDARNSIRSLMTWKFLWKVVVPSVLDLLVTGARYAAIVYVSPSVVSIMKTSVQLVVLTFLRICCRKKVLTKGQLLAILGVLVGNVIACASTIIRGDISNSAASNDAGQARNDTYMGLILLGLSGTLGAFRNTIEEILLQDDGLDANALLFLESVISFITSVIVGVMLMYVLDPPMTEYWNTWTTTGVIPTVSLFILFMYGKDLGKLLVTKFSEGGAVHSKMLALVFPFGTWALSLMFYYCVTEGEEHPIGGGWSNPWSFLRLTGFVLIIASVWFFKVAQQSKKDIQDRLLGDEGKSFAIN